MAIKIMIDSASDISKAEGEKLGLGVLPIVVSFGDQEFLDGDDLFPEDFYKKLESCDDLPKTSMINEYRFEEEFSKAVAGGDEVIMITLSSKISGTYNAACNASKKFKGVYVVDSLNATSGQRLLGEYALSLVRKGMNAQEIVNELNQKKLKLNVTAMIDTLKYLKKGGRISSAVAFAGQLLSLKPIAGLRDGEVKMIGKVMGHKKAFSFIAKTVDECGGIDYNMPLCVIYSGLDNSIVKRFKEQNAHLWIDGPDAVPEYILGATIGTHIGPGAVGIVFFEK